MIALVLADPPRPGECLPALEPVLGPEGCARLQAVLLGRASRWARAVAPDRAIVATERMAGESEAQRRSRACAEAFERFGEGRLLLALAGVPRLHAGHAADAVSDLDAGAAVSFGPANDGGYYLLALARPLPELFELDPEVWSGPLVLPRTIERAAALGLEGGLLRMERVLATPQDAQAMLADPLTPPDVRAILGSATESVSADR